MLVSTDLPPSTALMEEPLPRWHTMIFRSSGFLPSDLSGSLGYEAVGSSVEAVATNFACFS